MKRKLLNAAIGLAFLYVIILGVGKLLGLALIYEELYGVLPILVLGLLICLLGYTKMKLLVKVAGIVVLSLVVFAIGAVMFFDHIFLSYPSNYFFKSPDNKIILIQETPDLSGVSIEAFDTKYIFYKKSLDRTIGFGEPLTPMGDRMYEVEWTEKEFVLTVFCGGTTRKLKVPVESLD